jgi:hypothetical protein
MIILVQSVYVLLFLVCVGVVGLSTPMQNSNNNKHIYASTISLDTTASYNNASALWNATTFTQTFPSTIAGAIYLDMVFSLNDLDVKFPEGKIEFRDSKGISSSNTYFTLYVYS